MGAPGVRGYMDMKFTLSVSLGVVELTWRNLDAVTVSLNVVELTWRNLDAVTVSLGVV